MKPEHFSLLVVDDNEMNRDMLTRRLQKRGYAVTVANGGQQALSLVKPHKFDLVLLDIMMPGIDGIQVLKSLRQTHSLVDLPVVMVSAKHTNDDMVNALSLGANDYVQKPIQFDVLLARIEMLLSRKGLEAELKQVAIQDGLTGLYNRWYFDQVLQKSLEDSCQYKKPLTLLLMDLDGFKQINDQLGHLKGDDVLRQLGQLLKENLRKQDKIFRYGGDEFVALFQATPAQSELIIDRLKQAFATWLSHYDLGNLSLGLSMGQVYWEPGMDPEPQRLLKLADAQLYQQKRDKHVDVLQRQLSEKSQQVRFQTSFLNGVDEMIVATDLQGKVIYVNQAFSSWCGLPYTQLMNQTLKTAMPSFEVLLEQVAQKQFVPHKIELAQPDRPASTILVKPSELKQERGTPYGHVFFASDISELEKTHQQLVKTQHFLERLNNENQLRSLLQLILEEAVHLIPNANSGTAQLFDEQTDRFKFVAAVGWSLDILSTIELPRTADIHPDNLPESPAIIEADLNQHDEQYLDLETAEKFATLGPPALSALSLPIYLDGKLVGKFNIDSTSKQHAFDQNDLKMLATLMPQIELSVRRAQAREHLENTNEQLKQMQQLLENLNTETKLQPILQSILEGAVNLIPNADSGTALLFDPKTDQFNFVAAVDWPMEVLSTVTIPTGADIHPNNDHAKPVIFGNDLRQHNQQNLSPESAEKLSNLGKQPLSILSFPVYLDDELVGRFNIDCTSKEEAFNDTDIELLSTIIPQIELAMSRAKTRERLENSNARLKQTQQLLENLNTETKLQPILQLILDEAVKLIPNADSGSAELFNDKSRQVEFVAAVGWPMDKLSNIKIPFEQHPIKDSHDHSIININLREQDQIVLDEKIADQFTDLGPPALSTLSLPIHLNGKLVGRFNLDNTTNEHAFEDDDVALLATLTPQIELALRRAHEREELENTNERLTRSQTFLKRLNSETQIQPLLHLILQEAVDLIPNANCGSAQLFNHTTDHVEFVAAVGWSLNSLSTLELPLSVKAFCVHDLENPTIVNISTMSQHNQQKLDPAITEKLSTIGPMALSTLSLPIVFDGELMGQFNIDNSVRECAFDETDIQLLSTLMPQIELAVKRVQENESLQQQQKRLKLAFQLGSELAEMDDIHDMASHAANWASKRYGYDLVGIALLQGEQLEVAAYCGSEDAQRFVGYSHTLDDATLVTKAVRTQEAVFIDDVTETSDYIDVDSRTRSELVVPITLRNEKFGALNLESYRKNAFSQQDLDLAYFLANQLAIAMSSLKREQDLKLSEQRYRSLFELAPDAIMLLDKDRNFVNVNPTACELLGYSKDEFLRLRLSQIIVPEERDSSDGRFEKALHGQSFGQAYVRHILTKEGHKIPLEAKTIPILDDQGKPKYVLVMGRDISKAQQLERKLRESEHSYRHIVEDSQVGVCIIQDDHIQFANKRMTEITGYSREELQKQHRLALIHPDDRKIVQAPVEERLKGNLKKSHYNFRLVHKQGHIVHLQVFGNLAEYKGKPATIGTLIDITAQRVAEEREQLLKRQLEDTALRTVTMLAKTLEERDQQTLGHCQRLSDLCMALGKKLKLSNDRLDSLKHAALLHDIGKIGVPEDILNKKGRLNETEWKIVKSHVEMGFELVRGIAPLRYTANIIAQHHENWNGSGYPNGFKGEDILLEARILSVVDAYDAMTKDRPYREAMSQAKALKVLKEGAGFQWDPVVVKIFLETLKDQTS